MYLTFKLSNLQIYFVFLIQNNYISSEDQAPMNWIKITQFIANKGKKIKLENTSLTNTIHHGGTS